MQAVVTQAPFKMEVIDKPRPVPGSRDALVRVTAAGVCAGDLHIYKGQSHYASFPIVAGHEMAGIIESIPAGEHGLQAGDAVVVDPFNACGRCAACRMGKPNCCSNLTILGVHRDGGFADFVVAPMDKLHRIPSGMPASIAVFAEPVAIGVHACRRAVVHAGDTVCILGCGPIGMLAIEVALARGARVLAADIHPGRLATAASLGAQAIHGGEGLLQRLLAATSGEGPSVVLEATGVPEIMELAIELVPPGGRVVILGLTAGETRVSFPGIWFTKKELTLLGSRTNLDCFPESLRLLTSGRMRFPAMATSFALREAPRLFATLSQDPGICHKAVLINENKI